MTGAAFEVGLSQQVIRSISTACKSQNKKGSQQHAANDSQANAPLQIKSCPRETARKLP